MVGVVSEDNSLVDYYYYYIDYRGVKGTGAEDNVSDPTVIRNNAFGRLVLYKDFAGNKAGGRRKKITRRKKRNRHVKSVKRVET